MSEANKASTSEMIAAGLHAIKRLPIARRNGQVTPPPSLRDLLKLFESYLVDKSHYAPPLKSLLFDAVQSLLPDGTALSTQWGKMDLCLVLKKWVLSALRLGNYGDQPLLIAKIQRNPRNKKLMSHEVYLQPEGSDETLTFVMASPSPVKMAGAKDKGGDSDAAAAAPLSPSSLMPDDFMEEIDALAGEAAMAEFPTVFYTPRVPTLSPNRSASNSEILPDVPGLP